jgi:dolichol-phosphate mannosyltransferase
VIERLLGVRGLVKGWTSILIAVLFIGGVQLICMGIIGEYVGRTYGESKRRPLYVLRERIGFESREGKSPERRQTGIGVFKG